MRAAATLGLTLAALALAGAALAATHDPKAPRTRRSAADTRRADSILLVRSDFAAGWTAAPKQEAPPCKSEPDESKLVRTAHADRTFLFKGGVAQVGSDVVAFATIGQARTDWRLSTLAATRTCLVETLRTEFGKGVKVVVRSAVALPAPKLGERALHYRLVYDLKGVQTLRGVTELIGVNTGRISVVLHSFSLGAPLPASALTALSKVLARRLVAASGGI
ncbi:MAG TPA: hypothetical protein VHD91_03525 [Gaiellaceae bacterium]|nr:hypothetical protein [Gaiellaceae bacterium]